MSTPEKYASNQRNFRATTIAMVVLAVLFTGFRFLARWKKGLTPGVDDYMLVVALLFLFVLTGLMLGLIHYGMGFHSSLLPVEDVMMIGKLLIAFECVYVTAVALTKISILLMYARIFPTKGFRIASIILGVVSISWAISIIFVSVFQCTPVARAWNPTIPGTCINLKGSFIGNAVPNIVTDIAILSLPVRAVWGLHANLVHRLSVIGMFLLGSFVIFTSIYRFTTLFQFDPTDVAWTLGNACTWCTVETSSGIISACMPTLRPIFKLVSSRFGSSAGTRDTRAAGSKLSEGYGIGDSALRPGNEVLASRKIQLSVVATENGSDDEIPLNSIRVDRQMTWHESSQAPSHHW
ncbi:unnamed protein product [Penicillium salamii]|uniref:Rhodopsin domain-containing protein n=1 Tax=Penicillium salamii TaxID=1612424 RepID=A0A9W4IY38_9EURO|nr:unnamed protein product [Penicillium salamii]CAG8226275.1 unnamed protein product [Penicillium salamii]CAG8327654.1 unnamed protein product [Penicillium salamii]CAG8360262.1 unnamed protein product [Penicillium salamii]CAG8361230.1 unnamed protein product [Penicillium salamii]